jgi:hypothetical protein
MRKLPSDYKRVELSLWCQAKQDATHKLGPKGAAVLTALTKMGPPPRVFTRLPEQVFALRGEQFDLEVDWFWSSLTLWAFMGSRLADRGQDAFEVTFDMNIMVFLHNILSRFELLPQWRKKKSQQSAQQRGALVRDKKLT